MQELIRVLVYPTFRLSGPEQAELLADYLPFVQTVPMPPVLPQVPYCPDPMDLPFLQLALVGQARVLVSLDRDVFDLAEAFAHFGGYPIHNLDDLRSYLCQRMNQPHENFLQPPSRPTPRPV